MGKLADLIRGKRNKPVPQWMYKQSPSYLNTNNHNGMTYDELYSGYSEKNYSKQESLKILSGIWEELYDPDEHDINDYKLIGTSDHHLIIEWAGDGTGPKAIFAIDVDFPGDILDVAKDRKDFKHLIATKALTD